MFSLLTTIGIILLISTLVLAMLKIAEKHSTPEKLGSAAQRIHEAMEFVEKRFGPSTPSTSIYWTAYEMAKTLVLTFEKRKLQQPGNYTSAQAAKDLKEAIIKEIELITKVPFDKKNEILVDLAIDAAVTGLGLAENFFRQKAIAAKLSQK